MSERPSAETLFFEALDKRSAFERAQYLDSACGDDEEVRRQVDKLLRAYPVVGNFLETTAIERFATTVALPFVTINGREPIVGDSDDDLSFLQPSTRADSLGRIGHYEVLEILGRGGFGIVLRAFDETLHRFVAVKVLAPRLAALASSRKQFIAEARSSAKIRHPNVVQVYSVEEQPFPYLVMEYIPGENVYQRLVRTGPFDAIEIARIGQQVASGLSAAHSMGLIHRDVKPDNILLESAAESRSGASHIKIGDFGLARAMDDVNLSQSGLVAGTPLYMAPEQATGEPLDQRTDLFSLGSVLYMMCIGHSPFRATNTYAVLRRVVDETPRSIREIRPEVPRWLDAIVMRLLAKQPEDRFASASEVAELLARHLAHPASALASTYDVDAANLPPADLSATLQVTAEFAPLSSAAAPTTSRAWRRWRNIAAAAAAVVVVGAGITEATGITNLSAAVIRLFSPEGTLVIEVDDPNVSVKLDDEELVITGAGTKEIRLKPGDYKVEARKGDQLVKHEIISIENNGRRVVRVTRETGGEVPSAIPDSAAVPLPPADADAATWENAVAKLSPDRRLKAVIRRLQDLNPDYNGEYRTTGEFDLGLDSPKLRDFSALRALLDLPSLFLASGEKIDLEPLRGMKLTRLGLFCSQSTDLNPLRGMRLETIDLSTSENVADISVLKGMPLTSVTLAFTQVSDLSPLTGAKLVQLNCDSTRVTDLSPLKGMPLRSLGLQRTKVVDFSPIADLPLTRLNCYSTSVSDAHLKLFERCKDLLYLNVVETSVTEKGVAKLHEALPKCAIEWNGGVINAN